VAGLVLWLFNSFGYAVFCRTLVIRFFKQFAASALFFGCFSSFQEGLLCPLIF
jgi:hypothetical protein